MKKEGFEFVTDKLSCFSAENAIADHYGIGGVDSSNLPSPLKVGNYNDVHIYGNKGRVECYLSISDKPKSENEHEYTHRVSGVEVVHSHRKL